MQHARRRLFPQCRIVTLFSPALQVKITQEIMKDLQNSFLYFFCCPEDETKPNWLKNSRIDVCGVLLGTVRDYFDDFKVVLHVSAFRKVVEQVLENCVIVILARICISP